jgi:hypothetical protein
MSAEDLGLADVVAVDALGLGLQPQLPAARGPSSLGSGDVARDCEQPRQRRFWHVVEPRQTTRNVSETMSSTASGGSRRRA